MPRPFKLLFKYILYFFIGFWVLYYIIYLVGDVYDTRIRLLKEQGLYKPRPKRKKVIQYYDRPPKKIDYDAPGLGPIDESDTYKEEYKKWLEVEPLSSKKCHYGCHKDWIWITILLWILTIYMYTKL